jgi:hypothetical protein
MHGPQGRILFAQDPSDPFLGPFAGEVTLNIVRQQYYDRHEKCQLSGAKLWAQVYTRNSHVQFNETIILAFRQDLK